MLRQLLSLCLLYILISACGKEFSFEGDGTGNPPGSGDTIIYKSTWEFKEGLHYYQGPVDTAYLTKEGSNQVLTINGKTANAEEKLTIIITGSGPITKKTYATNQFQVKFLYLSRGDTVYSARPYFGGDMSVTITGIDDRHVAGNFRGIALDNVKNDKQIIEGQFISPVKKSSGSGTGGVLLWASDNCNGPIKVKVENLPGEITAFPFVTPDCGEAGSASFTLKPGTYRWVAYCLTDSITGNVNVSADSCSKVKVVFPFRPATETNTSEDSCVVETIQIRITNSLTTISAEFVNDKVDAISFFVDVYGGFMYNIRHSFEYSQSTINILDARHQFSSDATGKIIQYTGIVNPNKWQSARIVTKYFYEKDFLSEVQVFKEDGTPFRAVKFGWENGNIKTIKAEYLAGGGWDEISVDYYPDKNIKAFPYLFSDIQELFYFQSALNIGHSSKNAIKSRRMQSYDSMGRLLSDNTWTYDNYVIDANRYIQSLTVRHSSPFADPVNYSFTYHCF